VKKTTPVLFLALTTLALSTIGCQDQRVTRLEAPWLLMAAAEGLREIPLNRT